MSDRVLFEVTGFREFQEKLKSLGNDKDKRREMIAVLRREAKDTVIAAKAEAPVGGRAARSNIKTRRVTYMPGNLRNSIGVITAKRAENPTVVVGPRALRTKQKNQSNYKVDGWYGHIVEGGHNIYRRGFKRKRNKNKKADAHNAAGARKRVPANAFMARAYDKTKGQASEKTAQGIAKYFQKRIDKLSNAR